MHALASKCSKLKIPAQNALCILSKSKVYEGCKCKIDEFKYVEGLNAKSCKSKHKTRILNLGIQICNR
jgi:hypothetical protein